MKFNGKYKQEPTINIKTKFKKSLIMILIMN